MAKKSPNLTDIHVGARIRMRRNQLRMSQEKLGDAVELTFQQIQKYEKGSNRVGASRLQQFADILQVPVSYFFDGAPKCAAQSQEPDYGTIFLSSKHGAKIERALRNVTDPMLLDLVVSAAEKVAEATKNRVVDMPTKKRARA